MDIFLIVVSGVLTVTAAIPYMVEIVRGKAKPRIVSWFTWSLLTGIACAAAFAEGHTASAILLLCATIEVLLIVILGFKHGNRKFERLDIVCQVAALVGLALWLIFNSPAVAVIAAVTIDLIGAIPTLKHSWQKPHEETWLTYVLGGLGGICTLLVIDMADWSVTSMLYPVYIVLINFGIAAIVLLSPNRRLPGEPAELREL